MDREEFAARLQTPRLALATVQIWSESNARLVANSAQQGTNKRKGSKDGEAKTAP